MSSIVNHPPANCRGPWLGGCWLAALHFFHGLLLAQTLTHGPFVGATTSSSARFYIRVAPSALANIRLSSSADFGDAVLGQPVRTDSARDYAALVSVENLSPNQLYYYQALVNGQPTGEVRRFETFPAAGERAAFHFAFGSCIVTRPEYGPGDGRVFGVIAQDEPRFFMQIGDWGYPDNTDTPQNPTNVFSADFARLQATYRAKYDTSYALQQLLRLAPIDYVYDDHDYMNDNCSATSYPQAESLKTVFVSTTPREHGLRAYQELFPGYALANPQSGIWHKFTFGNADFFMLDTRARRSPDFDAFRYNAITDSIEFAPPPGHSMLAGEATSVGENQMDWLLRELQASQADWKFIVSTVPFNKSLRGLVDLSVSLQDSMIFLPGLGNQSLLRIALELSDKWVGFPADQERVLQFVHENNIKNIIVLSGDLHTAAIDDGANAGLPELMAGALDQANSYLILILQLLGYHIWNGGGQTDNFNDAYGRVTIFGADSVYLEIVDEFGTLLARQRVLPQGESAVAASPAPAQDLQLYPSYPNPITTQNAPATIHYRLAQRARVQVFVYDLLGRKVREFAGALQEPGLHAQVWDGRNGEGAQVSHGIYLIRVRMVPARGREQWVTQKITWLR